jgi:hypothetical protein
MKVVSRMMFMCLTLAGAAQAEVPVYQDRQFELPTAVVMTDAGPVYYGDVCFTTNPDGSLKLADAKRRNFAEVKTVAVAVDQNFPAQAIVTANGLLSIACVALEEPAVVREGKTFYVVLAETPIDPLALCMPLIAETKFHIQVPLDLRDLEAGEYKVDVNGVETTFTLANDNF